MTLFSAQRLMCCICGRGFETTCNTMHWLRGVCSMRCFYEKEWRYTLSLMGKLYRRDERTYNDKGYPVEKS